MSCGPCAGGGLLSRRDDGQRAPLVAPRFPDCYFCVHVFVCARVSVYACDDVVDHACKMDWTGDEHVGCRASRKGR